MRRYDMLPSYHFEDSVNGIIEKPVEPDMRDYVIEGNCGKNLIPSIPEKAFNGVTLSKVNDYYILNGTCTESTNYVPFSIIIPAGTYTISANNPVTNNTGTAIIQLYNPGLEEAIAAWDSKISATATKTMTGDSYQFRIRVQKGITYDNFIIKPQLEIGDTATEYEPYKAVGELSPNLISYPYYETTKTANGVTWTDNGDGSISVSGTNTSNGYVSFLVFNQARGLMNGVNIGDTITFSTAEQLPTGMHINVNGRSSAGRQIAGITVNSITKARSHTIPEKWVGMLIQIYVKSGATVDTVIKPQLEIGTTATDYVPYGKYKLPVVVGGKNELVYPYFSPTKTESGITFTSNKDGSVTANGTATSNAFYYCRLSKEGFKLDKNKLYYLSGCPGGSASTYLMTCDFYNDTTFVRSLTTYYSQLINPSLYDYNCNNIGIKVTSGATLDNVVFKPMLQDITDLPNLITYPYAETTKTANGVTFTDNGDGSITANGTVTDTTKVNFAFSTRFTNRINASKGVYAISGCPSGGSGNTYYIACDIYKGNTWVPGIKDIGNIGHGDLSSYDFDSISVYIMIQPGTTVENLVFKPKLVKVSTDYEPYITPTTTNILLDSPLKPGESISYRADNLPSVTLKKNVTNTVKVDTEIQPKSVKCQYYTY